VIGGLHLTQFWYFYNYRPIFGWRTTNIVIFIQKTLYSNFLQQKGFIMIFTSKNASNICIYHCIYSTSYLSILIFHPYLKIWPCPSIPPARSSWITCYSFENVAFSRSSTSSMMHIAESGAVKKWIRASPCNTSFSKQTRCARLCCCSPGTTPSKSCTWLFKTVTFRYRGC